MGWEARAARVCCGTRREGSRVGAVVRLPAGTVILQDAANAFLDHCDVASSSAVDED